VPGCKGKAVGNWDYCYDPTGSIELSGGNDAKATNLQACTGECDSDEQCAAGLKCFQRDGGQTIPGCTGPGAAKDWDYCFDPMWKPSKLSDVTTNAEIETTPEEWSSGEHGFYIDTKDKVRSEPDQPGSVGACKALCITANGCKSIDWAHVFGVCWLVSVSRAEAEQMGIWKKNVNVIHYDKIREIAIGNINYPAQEAVGSATQTSEFVTVTSGTCVSNGHEFITSIDVCGAAKSEILDKNRLLGINRWCNGQCARSGGCNGSPTGCYQHGGEFYLSDSNCGSCSVSSPCVCRKRNGETGPVETEDLSVSVNELIVRPSGSSGKLRKCEGDCNYDSDCEGHLKCFQRTAGVGLTGPRVPGCTGIAVGNEDYCYDPTGSIELSGGNDGKATNLQACIGECDSDKQCAAGLKCFQRNNGETIPGCTGPGHAKDWDYCFDPMWKLPKLSVVTVTSGSSCEANGYLSMSTEAECFAQRTCSLCLIPSQPFDWSRPCGPDGFGVTDRPSGCYLRGTTYIFNDPHRNANCGSCSEEYPCVCFADGPTETAIGNINIAAQEVVDSQIFDYTDYALKGFAIIGLLFTLKWAYKFIVAPKQDYTEVKAGVEEI